MDISKFSAQALSKSIVVPAAGAPSASVALPGVGNILRVVNDSTVTVYISVGTGAQTANVASTTATATSTALSAGSTNCFSIPANAVQQISAVSVATAGNIVVSVGEGS